MEDGVADALHRELGVFVSFGRAFVQDLESFLWILLVVEATGADGLDPLDEVVGHGGFTLDAADAGGGAALADPIEPAGIAFRRGKKLVPVEDRADVGIAGVGAALADDSIADQSSACRCSCASSISRACRSVRAS